MIALLAAAAVTLAAAQQSAIRVAETYIEDRLKDPFSARFRHVITTSVADEGRRSVNVCGYVYSKNGEGLYDGGSRFVVGVKNGAATGVFWTIDKDEEASAIFGSLGEAVCSAPFGRLEAKRRALVAFEVAADEDAHTKYNECYKASAAETAASRGSTYFMTAMETARKHQTECLSTAYAEWRQAYSRIFGFEWTGDLGRHWVPHAYPP